MDPAALAATAVAVLLPYLHQLAGRVTERTADALSDSGLPKVQQLYQALKERLRPGSYAGNVLEGAEERPDSEGRQQALGAALAEELERDPDFAADVERLIAQAQEPGGATFSVTDSGAVAGRDVVQRGRNVAGRDLTIGTSGAQTGTSGREESAADTD
ncbi:hypothetical protein [Streptomyces sp. RP5T]|uniref:hypothetical protein n=1 Tax=Streptomyces sp. RP5T TaxID=2490848 RepID=UPI000F652832|nr:hypothetical protein [Streptomyces sp. RP5T]RRR77627.1 hypothetical protein EHS43_27895 [Streptomyces sp. RP5T]